MSNAVDLGTITTPSPHRRSGLRLTYAATRWIAAHPGGPEVLDRIEVFLPEPVRGEVIVDVAASGMNPADLRTLAHGRPTDFPLSPGFEVAGSLAAIGPGTEIASGPAEVGDDVVAFRISGGYSSAVTVKACDVFAKPQSMSFPEAANLLLVGSTAAEMLDLAGVGTGDTVLLHGASGAVGASVLQQASLLGVRVVGTAAAQNFDIVERFGGVPVPYGDGLEAQARDAAPGGYRAALDAVGTREAVDVSLRLVVDRHRIVTIAAPERAAADGFLAISSARPKSAAFRDRVRSRLIGLAAAGDLSVPLARTYRLTDAKQALVALGGRHAPGKLALTADTHLPPEGNLARTRLER